MTSLSSSEDSELNISEEGSGLFCTRKGTPVDTILQYGLATMKAEGRDGIVRGIKGITRGSRI